jgi:Tfp pilus assembly protein PilZ
MSIIWLQKTMMRSVIQSNAVKEAKAVWIAYSEYIKNNGHLFKEKKKENKMGHGIEPARVPQVEEQKISYENLSNLEKLHKNL